MRIDELQSEKAGFEANFTERLGVLRYAMNLQQARALKQANRNAAGGSGRASGSGDSPCAHSAADAAARGPPAAAVKSEVKAEDGDALEASGDAAAAAASPARVAAAAEADVVVKHEAGPSGAAAAADAADDAALRPSSAHNVQAERAPGEAQAVLAATAAAAGDLAGQEATRSPDENAPDPSARAFEPSALNKAGGEPPLKRHASLEAVHAKAAAGVATLAAVKAPAAQLPPPARPSAAAAHDVIAIDSSDDDDDAACAAAAAADVAGPSGASTSAAAAAASLAAAALPPTAPAATVNAAAADAAAAATAQADEEEECPVCAEPLVSDCMLGPCGHNWCTDCHKKLRKMAPFKCPLCNKAVSPKDVTHVKVAEPQPQSDAEMHEAGPSAAPAPGTGGSYGTKIDAVVDAVQTILTQKPDDKVSLAAAVHSYSCPGRQPFECHVSSRTTFHGELYHRHLHASCTSPTDEQAKQVSIESMTHRFLTTKPTRHAHRSWSSPRGSTSSTSFITPSPSVLWPTSMAKARPACALRWLNFAAQLMATAAACCVMPTSRTILRPRHAAAVAAAAAPARAAAALAALQRRCTARLWRRG